MFYWTDSMYTVPNGGPQNHQNGSLDKYGMDLGLAESEVSYISNLT